MDETKNKETLMLARGYLDTYASRYNYFFPDSMPTYSGFAEWAEKHKVSCSPLEKRVLTLFLTWLHKQNSIPHRRINSINKGDIQEFIDENLQSILLNSLLSCR
jgi:hypothetical protein